MIYVPVCLSVTVLTLTHVSSPHTTVHLASRKGKDKRKNASRDLSDLSLNSDADGTDDGDGYGEMGLRGTLELGVGITIGIQIEDPRGWGVWDYFD